MDPLTHISGVSKGTFLPDKNEIKGNTFKDTLNNAIRDVNDMMMKANNEVEKMASGETTDLHQVMIAVEKASLGFEMALEIRNKLIDSYRELMRMQI